MKKYISLVFISLYFLSSCTSATGDGLLVLESSYNNTDTIDQSGIVERKYLVRNKGKAPSNILNIVSSCGCTTSSENYKRILKPNDTTHIIITYKPMRNDSANVTKAIVIQNDSKSPLLEISLSVFVKR
ncbi:MAG: DUF1573 domain-containing protein [Chitinophagaceae bacterium]|nr:DUF1573 domain-containing protein [Chitinophagaceae bacterium]